MKCARQLFGRRGAPRSRPRITQSQEGRQTEDSSGRYGHHATDPSDTDVVTTRDMDLAGSRPRGRKRGRGEDSSRGPSEMAPHQNGSTPDDRDGNEHAPIMNTQAAQDRENLSHWQPTTSPEKSAWKELNKDWHRSMRDAEVYYSKDRRGTSKDWYERPGRPGCSIPIFDDIWTASDELNLGSQGCGLALMNALENLNANDGQALCTLFDNCLRLFRADPLTLFSIQNLEFDNPQIDHDEVQATTPLWSSDFCRKLSVLMAHPMWKGKKPHSFMLFAIKWVVICRTDDRHPPPQSDIELLKWVGTSLDPDANDKPFGIHHQEHQHNIREQGGWSSPEADLLSAIWRMTGSSARLTRAASDPYVVSTADLTVLIDALDGLGQGGMKIRCEVHYQVFQGTHIGPVYPSGIAELKTLYRNCWLNVQRAKARREREGNSLSGGGATQDPYLSRSGLGLGGEEEEGEIQSGLLSIDDVATPKTHHSSPLINSGDTDTQDPDSALLQSLPRDIPNLEPRRTRPKKAVCYKFPYCTCMWNGDYAPCQRE
ncbi:uncharacterized protein NECHADRAFT_85157 [Fusarium vanettenii 77-13-4]|uniref:Uncharacterized protein n=1 Tax=Fusarium vanettenii (strain ATCC MYA-4622 / CBS 123669 / FGSC 9596 / NRRL 45880 / 77-13-4) TaxID=660122 RepID=C7YV55_FUSV7|nr:uncharacterized protein NECHADRAFT_85157 [Fusarium vanettenii 77-13-4]EEU44926.1 predicted protein [Fusarium vanettenii 77-13-4]